MVRFKGGFSLVELSLVLIVIGLLIAGVTAGSRLIKQSVVHKVIQEYSNFNTAVTAFFLEYRVYPGDMSNAHDYWGSSCDSTASKCNGDGDGIIEEASSASANDVESVRAWQHLKFAETINEPVTGLNSAWERTPGVNIPASVIDNAGWMFHNTTHAWWVSQMPWTKTTNIIVIGAARASNWNDTAAVPVLDMYNIDAKIDDGNANLGKVIAKSINDASNCHTTGTYNVSNGKKCLAAFSVNVD